MMKPFELLSRLAAAAQPSGFEGPQAAILAELARPFADEVRTERTRQAGHDPRPHGCSGPAHHRCG